MKKYLLFLLMLSWIFSVSGQGYGLGKGLVYLYAGGTTATLNTDAQFTVTPQVLENFPTISTSISLEKDLNFPSTSELFYIKGIVGGRIQLVASYFSLHRTGGATLSKSFAFGDNIYTVSAPVSGYFNTDYYSGTLRFSILHNHLVTAGLSIGARYLKIGAGIKADSMGYVFDESGKEDLPVFVPGIHASVYAIENLLIRGSLEYFSLSLNGTKGVVLESNLTAEYYFLKFLGAGIGYSWMHLKAENLPENPIYLQDINYKVDGLQVFAAFRF